MVFLSPIQYTIDAKREVGARALINTLANAEPNRNAEILDVCAGTGVAGVQVRIIILRFKITRINSIKKRILMANVVLCNVF